MNLFFLHQRNSAFPVRSYCCVGEYADEICKILLLPASYGPRESGSSLRVSFFVADRKQLQIARGIAAHGARQTEVSENKPRAVVPLQPRNKAEEITNATPARFILLPRETGTRIKMRTGLSDADGRFYCHDNQNAFRKSDACFSNCKFCNFPGYIFTKC